MSSSDPYTLPSVSVPPVSTMAGSGSAMEGARGGSWCRARSSRDPDLSGPGFVPHGATREVRIPLVVSVLSEHTPHCTLATMPLTIQKAAPDFAATAVMPNGDFKDIKLSDYKGKYVVLFFYPLDFTFVCPTEICAFSDRAQEFKDIDCEIIGVSVDSKYSHLAWSTQPRKEGGLGGCQYPLVADITKAISKDYEVLIEEGDDAGIALRCATLPPSCLLPPWCAAGG
mmetsp:Transcript_29095/g.92873  ORF Transcript_29095/g.92873 Transcript_29095/m.92873 type:complete len:227 (-) Transcript_29095:611-1291(-)